MGLELFVLSKENKRKLIEISLIVFSIITAFLDVDGSDSNILGPIPVIFLFLSLIYWISLDRDKIYNHWGFKLVAASISISFTATLSYKLLQLSTAPLLISKMLFWGYYLTFMFIFYTALISDEDINQQKRQLKSWAKIILPFIFILIIYFLSIF